MKPVFKTHSKAKLLSTPTYPYLSPSLRIQRPKRRPSLRDPYRQRAGRQKNTQAPENRHEPEGVIGVGVPAIVPQRPQAGRLLGIHVGAQFTQAVGVDGELAVGDAFVGQLAVWGPVEEEVVLHFEAVGVGVGVVGGGVGVRRGGRGEFGE